MTDLWRSFSTNERLILASTLAIILMVPLAALVNAALGRYAPPLPSQIQPLADSPMQARPTDSILNILSLDIPTLLKGLALIGETGSGKTSAIHRIMVELMQQKLGCLWTTVKPDEPHNAARVMRKAGRRDVVMFTPGITRYNPLVFELYRPGGSPESVATLFDRCDETLSNTRGGKSDEKPFWRGVFRETVNHAVGAVWLTYGRQATFQHVYDLVSNAPCKPEEVDPSKQSWRDNRCRQILALAKQVADNEKHPDDIRRIDQAIDYFATFIPNAGHEVQGAAVMRLIALLAPFVRGQLYDTVNCEESDITPDWVLDGHVLIFNCPVLESQGNHFLQLLFSQQFTEAALARKDVSQKVVLLTDEYHMVASPNADSNAQSQFRSQGVIAIRAFQSLSILQNAMVEGFKGKHQAMSILGNLASKLFLSNSDNATWEYFSELCGKEFKLLTGGGQSPQQNPQGGADPWNMNFHQQLLPRKLGSALTNLKTGGAANDFIITAYIHQSGKQFDENKGLPFIKIAFEQDIT